MTGKQLLYHALDLCGLRKNDGTLPADVADLEQRAVSLINILLAENAILDSKISGNVHTVKTIAALDDELDFTEIVETSVLPYGLARLFMLGEDDNLAVSMNRLYNESRENALRFGKAKIKPITEVYS